MSDSLFQAAASGDLATIRQMVDADQTLVHAVNGANLAIHTVAENNQADVVAFLLDRGADVNVLGEDGRTPLHFASDWQLKTARLLIQRGAVLDVVDDTGHTPLALAIIGQTEGGQEISQLLLSAGAKYDLLAAGSKGDLERVQTILREDSKAIEAISSPEALLSGIVLVGEGGTMEDRVAILKLLFSHGLKVSQDFLAQLAESCSISQMPDFESVLRQHITPV